MKIFLHAWKGLLVAGEKEKPKPSSVFEIACHLGDAGQPLTPLLALDEDLSTPCKHADADALQESGEKLLCGRIQRQDCCCCREVRKQLLLKTLSIPHNS